MSASEPEETAKEPQSVEERLGESMIPLTQLGLTDLAVPNESEQSSSFTSHLYLPPTPRPLMQSVRGSDTDECIVKNVVTCNDSPVASGIVTDNGPQPPKTQEAGFVTPMNVNVQVVRGVELANGRQPAVVPPHRVETAESPRGRGHEPPLAKEPPHEAQARDSDSASYVSSEAEGSAQEAPRRGRVRRRPRAAEDERLREILVTVRQNGDFCRQLGERVDIEIGGFRRVMTDIRAAQERMERRLEVQGVLIDQTRGELVRLNVRQDTTDERLGRVEGEVRELLARQAVTAPEGAVPEGGYQSAAGTTSVSRSPELISAPGSVGMEVGSQSSPVLHSPTMTSTPAARSHTGPTVCAPSPEVSRHRPTACAPDGFGGSYSTGVSSYSDGVSPPSEEDGQQVKPAEAAAAAAAPTVRFQPPKQNQNQVQLPKYNGTGNLRSFLNQLDNAAVLGHWTPEYKAGQCYAQLTEGALAFIDSRPSADRQTFDRLSEVLQEKYEGKVERQRAREGLRHCKQHEGETVDDLATRVKELARKAHGEPDRQEEEALAALKRALPDTMAQTIVIQWYATVDECTQHLAELEALQEEKCPTLPATSASPPRDKPARARAGKVRQVATATDGQGQESAEQNSPKRGPVTSGRKRRASSSGSDTSEKSLRDEIQEGFET